jgi:hypothetical protein
MHVIRLRGPWEYSPLESCDSRISLPAAGKVTMPCDWGDTLGRDFRGRVCYLRRFGRPTLDTPGERVWLVLLEIRGGAVVSLNGERLGEIASGQPGRFEVTDRLDERNVLEVIVEQPPDAREPGGIVGDVRLEIE